MRRVWGRGVLAEVGCSGTSRYSAGGGYVNFMMSEGQDRIRAAYRGNYDRLARIKQRYDPDNTFHINQSIQFQPQPQHSQNG